MCESFTVCREMIKERPCWNCRRQGTASEKGDPVSDTAMECLKVVDIRVKFGKLSPVILQDVLVCKIGFNVVSPWQASMNGWA